MTMVSLKAVVGDCLKKHCQQSADGWERKMPTLDGVDMNDQLTAVNNFWRLQLGQLRADTISTREWLQDDIPVSSWLKDFERFVVPVIIQHRLPL